MSYDRTKDYKKLIGILLTIVMVGLLLCNSVIVNAEDPAVNASWWTKKYMGGISEQHFKITVTIPRAYGYANDISKAYNSSII